MTNKVLDHWLENHDAEHIWHCDHVATADITYYRMNDHIFLTIVSANDVQIMIPVTTHRDLASKLSALARYCELD